MAKSEVEMGAFSKWVAGFDNNLEDYYIERPQNKWLINWVNHLN